MAALLRNGSPSKDRFALLFGAPFEGDEAGVLPNQGKEINRSPSCKEKRPERPIPDSIVDPPACQGTTCVGEVQSVSCRETGNVGSRFFIAPEKPPPEGRAGMRGTCVMILAMGYLMREDDGNCIGG